ncbi:hypothetical protein VR43_20145 [Streptomyces sp. NRRL S-104]|nr:hypothetical protein VR43_20145 [Streptomyces sp. NRRL S-104]
MHSQAAGVDRGGDDVFRVRVRGAFPAAHEVGRRREDLRESGVGAVERGTHPRVLARPRQGPGVLGGGERVGDVEDAGQFEQPAVLVAAAVPRAARGEDAGLVLGRPDRSHDHRAGVEQGAYGPLREGVRGPEVGLQFVQPQHGPRCRRRRQLADRSGARRLDQPPLGQHLQDGLVERARLAHAGAAVEEQEAAVPCGVRQGRAQALVQIARYIARRLVAGFLELDRDAHPEPVRQGLADPDGPRGGRPAAGARPFEGCPPRAHIGQRDLAHHQVRQEALRGRKLPARGIAVRRSPRQRRAPPPVRDPSGPLRHLRVGQARAHAQSFQLFGQLPRCRHRGRIDAVDVQWTGHPHVSLVRRPRRSGADEAGRSVRPRPISLPDGLPGPCNQGVHRA